MASLDGLRSAIHRSTEYCIGRIKLSLALSFRQARELFNSVTVNRSDQNPAIFSGENASPPFEVKRDNHATDLFNREQDGDGQRG